MASEIWTLKDQSWILCCVE